MRTGPTDDTVLATITDQEGRDMVLLRRIWEGKIMANRPELTRHLAEVLATVAAPDHREPDPRRDRSRCFRRTVGPSRWLLVIVSYEQKPARIITAMAHRRDPRQWTP